MIRVFVRPPAFRFLEDTNHGLKCAYLPQSKIFSKWVAMSHGQEVIDRLPRTRTGAQHTIVLTKNDKAIKSHVD